MTLLAVDSLSVAAGPLPILDGVSFALQRGEILALVGESGSGKTMAARAAIGLLPRGVAVTGGAIRFDGADLARMAPEALRRMRGPGAGMVFQEPMVSLNPAHTIGAQMAGGCACTHASPPPGSARAAATCWPASASPTPIPASPPIPTPSPAACASAS